MFTVAYIHHLEAEQREGIRLIESWPGRKWRTDKMIMLARLTLHITLTIWSANSGSQEPPHTHNRECLG